VAATSSECSAKTLRKCNVQGGTSPPGVQKETIHVEQSSSEPYGA